MTTKSQDVVIAAVHLGLPLSGWIPRQSVRSCVRAGWVIDDGDGPSLTADAPAVVDVAASAALASHRRWEAGRETTQPLHASRCGRRSVPPGLHLSMFGFGRTARLARYLLRELSAPTLSRALGVAAEDVAGWAVSEVPAEMRGLVDELAERVAEVECRRSLSVSVPLFDESGGLLCR